MVAVAQPIERAQGWFSRHRAHSRAAVASRIPEGVHIRRRKDHQLAACARLLGLVSVESAYPIPRQPDRREWLSGEDVLYAWTAEEHGRVQGHVALARVDRDPMTAMRWREVTGRPPSELAEVSRFFVRSSARGRGIGTALLETAVDESRARGLLPVGKMISTSRRGVPFYDRAGWRMVAMYPCGRREDGLETYLYVAPPTHARGGSGGE